MAKRVFFSFHFNHDAWRANQVRNSWVTKPNREAAGFFDAADQEEVKRSSDVKIKRWIDAQLQHTSVTAVLIGQNTSSRRYVRYEIERSFERGNALLGIRIHNLKNQYGETDYRGANPLDEYIVNSDSGRVRLSELYPTYDWINDNGNRYFSSWVDEASRHNDEIPQDWRNDLVHKENLEERNLVQPLITGVAVGAAIGLGKILYDEYLNHNYRRGLK